MKINSEKKHSIRYDAISNDTAVTSIYVMKKDLHIPPSTIIVKVEIDA